LFLLDSQEAVMAVAITRTDYDAAGLRQAAAQSKDADAARRMLALAMILDGYSRAEAAKGCGMDRQTLRDWVHRYNDEGLPGLSDRKPPGAKPRLSPQQQDELAQLVRSGPDLAEHGVIRWRRIDLSKVIEARFGVQLAERSVGALLCRMGFRHMSLRPHNPAQDPAAIEAHKKTSPSWSPPPSPSMRATSRSNSGGRTRPGSASKGP
jgi:transposase